VAVWYADKEITKNILMFLILFKRFSNDFGTKCEEMVLHQIIPHLQLDASRN
jgi:hypothetical protein